MAIENRLKKEVELLAKRLLGAMHYGFRIEQDSGHRYIIIDLEADFLPGQLKEEFSKNLLPDDYQHYIIKEYGSFITALDVIDKMLERCGPDINGAIRSTLLGYNNLLIYAPDDGNIFGTNPVE
jgi:hypothetical protein